MVFSLAIIPIHYLASFYFEAAATGFSKMCFMNIFTGEFTELLSNVFSIFDIQFPAAIAVAHIVNRVLLV